MAEFKVNILGCGSATPSLRHMPSCQIVEYHGKLMMVDCGEGAQLGMRRMGLKFSRLNNIFISHLHGDHCLGLPGLLSTLALHGTGGTVSVYTFPDGCEMFSRLVDHFCHERSYNLNFQVIAEASTGVVYEDRSLTVESFPLYHRVPCTGFIFREKPKQPGLRADMLAFYDVPIRDRAALKDGADFVAEDGRVIPNERFIYPPQPSKSYAYCSDTLYDPRVAEAVRGIDVIYHEATYIDIDSEKAHQRGHATASEAARIAVEAGARKLILGHYSKSYHDESGHFAEARAYADSHGRPDLEIVLANEGLTIDID